MSEKHFYNSQDIAIYILNYCDKKKIPVSNRWLQYLLYFVQGAFYRIFDRPCFGEDFQCWRYGPTIEEEYQKYRRYGSGDIPKIYTISMFDFTSGEFVEKEWKFEFREMEEESIVRQVVDDLSRYSMSQISDVVLSGKAYRENYRKNEQRIIPKEDIRRDFRK